MSSKYFGLHFFILKFHKFTYENMKTTKKNSRFNNLSFCLGFKCKVLYTSKINRGFYGQSVIN